MLNVYFYFLFFLCFRVCGEKKKSLQYISTVFQVDMFGLHFEFFSHLGTRIQLMQNFSYPSACLVDNKTRIPRRSKQNQCLKLLSLTSPLFFSPRERRLALLRSILRQSKSKSYVHCLTLYWKTFIFISIKNDHYQ